MINDYINSKNLLARIDDDYSIQSSDYIAKFNNWVLNVLKDIAIKQIYQELHTTIEFNNYRCKLPNNINKVYAIYINNYKALLDVNSRLKLTSSQNTFVSDFNGNIYENKILPESVIPLEDTVVLTNEQTIISNLAKKQDMYSNGDVHINYKISQGWIHTNVESGTCEIIAGAFPYLYDNDLDIMFPLIPNDENLINAIIQYCLKTILLRGYKHPILSLEKNNEIINPAMSYETYKKKARVSCNSLSPDAKESLSRLLLQNII